MNCSRCGAEMLDGFAFCCKCGAPREEKVFCGKCGAELLDGFAFCCKCGTPRPEQKAAEPEIPAVIPAEPVYEAPQTEVLSEPEVWVAPAIPEAPPTEVLSEPQVWAEPAIPEAPPTEVLSEPQVWAEPAIPEAPPTEVLSEPQVWAEPAIPEAPPTEVLSELLSWAEPDIPEAPQTEVLSDNQGWSAVAAVPEKKSADRCCPNCGVKAEGAFCIVCGTPLPKVAAPVQPEPVKQEKPRCANCGAEVDGAFCMECGTAVNAPKKNVCANCGAVLNGTAFCMECGTPTGVVPPAAPEQKKPEKAKKEKPAKAPEEKKEKPAKAPKEKKPATGPSVGIRIVSIVLSVLLAFSCLTTVLLFGVRQLVAKENINKITGQILSASPEMLGSERDSVQELLISVVYNEVYRKQGDKMKLTKDQMIDLVAQSDGEDFIREKLSGYISDYIHGTNETKISNKEVKRLLQKEEKLLRRYGIEPNEQFYSDVDQILDNADLEQVVQKQVFDEVDKTKVGGTTIKDMVSLLQTVTSLPVLIGLGVFTLALAIVIIVLNIKRIGGGLLLVGWPVAIVGLLTAAAMLMLQMFPDVLSLPDMVGNAVQTGVAPVALVCYLTLAGGVLLVVLGFVLKALQKKKQKV